MPENTTGRRILENHGFGGPSAFHEKSGLAGGEPAIDEAEATITVVDPTEGLIGQKLFSPSSIEGIPGDEVTAILNTKVDKPKSNVDVREIVQTDIFGEMLPAWKPTTVKIESKQGADTVKIEYKPQDNKTGKLGAAKTYNWDIPAGTASPS